VEEYNTGLRMCRIMFFFSENPYFQNDIVTKDYQLSMVGMYGHRLWGVAWAGVW
jgi:hypothetical protein